MLIADGNFCFEDKLDVRVVASSGRSGTGTVSSVVLGRSTLGSDTIVGVVTPTLSSGNGTDGRRGEGGLKGCECLTLDFNEVAILRMALRVGSPN